MAARYAIYYAPPAGAPLTRFGATHLGYDAFAATEIGFPRRAAQTFADWPELTADPRRYGFHATLKAPFFLRDGAGEHDLVAAFESFVARPRALPTIVPVVRAIGRFIAIIPKAPVTALTQLADDCVRDFEPLRAPLTVQDRERRLKSPLSAQQIANLDRWGYPYVFDEFRFHMTLTGSVPEGRRDAVLQLLQEEFAALDLARLTIGHLAIFRQSSSDERFTVLRQAELRDM